MLQFPQDGLHELVVYRCDEASKLKPHHYLILPSSIREQNSNSNPQIHFTASHKESLHIRSLLCSTKLTQNGKYYIINLFFLSTIFQI